MGFNKRRGNEFKEIWAGNPGKGRLESAGEVPRQDSPAIGVWKKGQMTKKKTES